MGGANAAKLACPADHEYDAANTYIRPDGGRGCKACRRESSKGYRQRIRELLQDVRRPRITGAPTPPRGLEPTPSAN